MPKKEKTIQTYNKIASFFSATHHDPSFWQKEYSMFKELIPGKKVIDIGCGAGRDAVLFARDGFDYVGIDASRGMIDEAKKRVKDGNFLVMDFYKLDFPDDSFDGFWASAAVLHVPKKEVDLVLQEFRRVLKDNGVGFISIKEKRILEEGIIKEEKYGGIERFFAFYENEEFSDILKKNNFKIIKHHVLKEGDTNWLCYFIKKG